MVDREITAGALIFQCRTCRDFVRVDGPATAIGRWPQADKTSKNVPREGKDELCGRSD